MNDVGLSALVRSTAVGRVGDGRCAMHASHSPRCRSMISFLTFPEALQKALWGEVRETDSVMVCPSGELGILLALYDLLAGTGWTRAYTPEERRFALRAFDAWQQAAAATT